MNYVTIKPDIFHWARVRAGLSLKDLQKKFPNLELWEKGKKKPTLKQLERFAKVTHTPLGWFFLEKPPEDKSPIPDFRIMDQMKMKHLSLNLLETIYICQRRQDWYKDYKLSEREKPLKFIGSVQPLAGNVIKTAENIRKTLNFDIEKRKGLSTWTKALRLMIEQAHSAGILVMVSGIVGNSTRRKLNPKEFRGFALSDPIAPLIFVNGADTKAAQIFTIGHELAHLWISQTGLSNSQALSVSEQGIENWCNKVAAELLVPLKLIHEEIKREGNKINFSTEISRLSRLFKVSSLVILRRIYDLKILSKAEFRKRYIEEVKKLSKMQNKKPAGGGDFFNSMNMRVSSHFAKALMVSAFEGYTPFREAFQLLGIKKMSTFKKTAKNFGVSF